MDRMLFKRWIKTVIIAGIMIALNIGITFGDDAFIDRRYILPFGQTGYDEQYFFLLLTQTAPYLALFLGFLLGVAVVKVILFFLKRNKNVEFVGFARADITHQKTWKAYLDRTLFSVLLSLNLWLMILNSVVLGFWIADPYKSSMYDGTGRLLYFVIAPWYWVCEFIAVLVFAMCAVILDSGLVAVFKRPEYRNYGDVTRVGTIVYNVVKGYLGITILISFLQTVTSPLGQEINIWTFPIVEMIFLLPFLVAMDLCKGFGRRRVVAAVKNSFPLQVLELDFKRVPVDTFEQIYNEGPRT